MIPCRQAAQGGGRHSPVPGFLRLQSRFFPVIPPGRPPERGAVLWSLPERRQKNEEKGGGGMAEKCRGYAGKIKNRSTQSIKAPYGGGSTKGTVKITGNDLRSGGKSGK